ncbi:MAG: hypothetical protein FJ271_32985 [Planctomycetes bacterium]|nr:hypothetical protein [Planctomycetota bacterium]
MNQNQLHREVAQATGETVELIRQRGFGIIIVPRPCYRRPRRGGQALPRPAKPVKPIHQPMCKAA